MALLRRYQLNILRMFNLGKLIIAYLKSIGIWLRSKFETEKESHLSVSGNVAT